MVFSSIPAYLDPSNWQQQQSHQSGDGSIAIPHLRQPLPPPSVHPSPPPPRPLLQQPHHVINNGDIMVASSINSPRSMSERARLANIPIPEPCLNCPRCESTNTKFCYFNNYNLTQPRHFCKTCKRYWTRGGALRSIPVGGGCRRNKRSKSISNSKSITSSDQHQSTDIPSYNSTNNNNTVLDLTRHLPQQLTLLSPLGQRSDHGGGGVSMINYGSFQSGDHTSELNNYQMGGGNGIGSFSLEQWRLNQLQYLGGLNSSIIGNGLYQIQGGGGGSGGGGSGSSVGGGGGSQALSYVGETSHNDDHQVIRDNNNNNNKPSNSVFTQLDLTDHKMEENQGLTRNLMGNPRNNSWSGATWSDYINTRFSSSCTKDPQ